MSPGFGRAATPGGTAARGAAARGAAPAGPPEAAASSDTPAGAIAGEVESTRGLGARLAELQAITGEFAIQPVDPPAELAPGRTRYPGMESDHLAARGLWDPKVPAGPEFVEPDEPEPEQPYDSAAVLSGWLAEAAEAGIEAAPTRPLVDTDTRPGDNYAAPSGDNYAAPSGEDFAGYRVGRGDDYAGPPREYGRRRDHYPGPREESAIPPPPPPAAAEPAPPPPAPVASAAPAQASPAQAPTAQAPAPFDAAGFEPVNLTEEDLLNASRARDTDRFLSILLLAKVLVPGHSAEPEDWPTEEINGSRYLITFTSPERYAERRATRDAEREANDGAANDGEANDGEANDGEATDGASDSADEARTVTVRFTSLISQWPDDDIGFAVNPGSPVGVTLSGQEVRTLAGWAVEVGLIGQPELEPEPTPPAPEPVVSRPPPPQPAPNKPLLMQKTVAVVQLPLYLERGYDRVSGFVHRVSEVGHLQTPEALYRALGLSYSGSQFSPDDPEVYVLRWAAHCPSLYRIPFGGQNEAGMQAMQGWVIERAPFRGNGFAPSETGDVIAEFKVDSVRLPHSAQLWRITREGRETLIAVFDADGPRWRQIGAD